MAFLCGLSGRLSLRNARSTASCSVRRMRALPCRMAANAQDERPDKQNGSNDQQRDNQDFLQEEQDEKEEKEDGDDEQPFPSMSNKYFEEIERLETEIEQKKHEGRAPELDEITDEVIARQMREQSFDFEQDEFADEGDDFVDDVKNWLPDEEFDIEKELSMELKNLAKELKYDSPKDLLEDLSLPEPESWADIFGKEDSFPEVFDEGLPYKSWRPDPRMSNEKTAMFLDPPVTVDGVVAQGFGRGSAQLGVPTANVEANVLGVAVAALENGVYFGWARVGASRRIHGAVLNIGYNPTYGDVKVRMLEAHLLSRDLDSFYGERLRLVLVGFLREERKFDNITELLRNIKNDILTSIIMLKTEQSRAQRKQQIMVER
eukprot:Plantae.Rhodophyta-Purpureofilum_apyrenoidigerum.ctg29434.p1 GENE.Plantae.Rhodophyta-Purpureofilum_apyrenoidigerum.ctg29434~~Plantae.Rhodophyta-Purpureofilum_apyrenoidigerum.ctg29434.p1  ORF type:complete len:409 (+),score=111.40 Plantae.Rhodophyta-Purpureofilum_apyrenoidigerum.ctg29434:101-1228(+)